MTANMRGWQIWALREPLRTYLLTVNVLALCVTSVAIAATHATVRDAGMGLALIGCGIVAIESTRKIRETHGEVIRDLQSIWLLAIAILLPPSFAMLAPVPLLLYKLSRIPRLVAYRKVFSTATLTLGYGSASVIFHVLPRSLAGHVPGSGTHALIWTLAVAACGFLAWVVNCGLVVLAVKLSNRESRLRDLIGSRESITADLLELSLAVSLTLVVAINPIFMALALPSVILCRRSIMRGQLVATARLDPMTGLLNAGTWYREAEVEFLRALRRRRSLAVAMVDIDDFENVTSAAGPDVGDQLIKDVAARLRDQLPGQNLIARFGREEFAILLPETGRQRALRISERLRDHIAGEPIAIETGPQAGFVFRLTISIGIAVLNESRRALTELVGAADSALSQAQRTGWSKVYLLPDGSTGTLPAG